MQSIVMQFNFDILKNDINKKCRWEKFMSICHMNKQFNQFVLISNGKLWNLIFFLNLKFNHTYDSFLNLQLSLLTCLSMNLNKNISIEKNIIKQKRYVLVRSNFKHIFSTSDKNIFTVLEIFKKEH